EDCGSTTLSTNWAAIAASTTEPPCASTASAVSVAAGLAVATIACAARAAGCTAKPVAISGASARAGCTPCAQAQGMDIAKTSSAAPRRKTAVAPGREPPRCGPDTRATRFAVSGTVGLIYLCALMFDILVYLFDN